jgi:hypothetical protein
MNVHGTFAITGEEGSGKSIISVAKIYEYLIRNRKVISNFDLYLDKLLPYWSKSTYIRVPDFPSAHDLWSCGEATQSANESEFGLVALDEIAVAANAREWNQNGRKELIDYFRQTRKHGYDKFFLSQGLDSIDAQIRKDLIKFLVVCRRTDSIRIPLIGWFLQLFGIGGMLPNMHIATVKNPSGRDVIVADRWSTTGKKWYSCYNTKQKFRPEPHEIIPKNQFRYTPTPYGLIKVTGYTWDKHTQYGEAIYSVLSAWHIKGRYMTKLQMYQPQITKAFYIIAFIVTLIYLPSFYKGYDKHIKTAKPDFSQYEKAENSIIGIITKGDKHYILLKGQNYVLSNKRTEYKNQFFYEYQGKQYTLQDYTKDDSSNSGLLPDLF